MLNLGSPLPCSAPGKAAPQVKPTVPGSTWRTGTICPARRWTDGSAWRRPSWRLCRCRAVRKRTGRRWRWRGRCRTGVHELAALMGLGRTRTGRGQAAGRDEPLSGRTADEPGARGMGRRNWPP